MNYLYETFRFNAIKLHKWKSAVLKMLNNLGEIKFFYFGWNFLSRMTVSCCSGWLNCCNKLHLLYMKTYWQQKVNKTEITAYKHVGRSISVIKFKWEISSFSSCFRTIPFLSNVRKTGTHTHIYSCILNIACRLFKRIMFSVDSSDFCFGLTTFITMNWTVHISQSDNVSLHLLLKWMHDFSFVHK